MSNVEEKARFRGSPNWFKYGCVETRAGNRTYRDLGWHLAGHAPSLLWQEVQNEELEGRLDVLRGHVGQKDVLGVIGWLQEELAGCLSLVPRRKWPRLAEGFLDRCREDGVVL